MAAVDGNMRGLKAASVTWLCELVGSRLRGGQGKKTMVNGEGAEQRASALVIGA